MMEKAAIATAEFHIENSFADGIPFWDTGAPGVASFGKITNFLFEGVHSTLTRPPNHSNVKWIDFF